MIKKVIVIFILGIVLVFLWLFVDVLRIIRPWGGIYQTERAEVTATLYAGEVEFDVNLSDNNVLFIQGNWVQDIFTPPREPFNLTYYLNAMSVTITLKNVGAETVRLSRADVRVFDMYGNEIQVAYYYYPNSYRSEFRRPIRTGATEEFEMGEIEFRNEEDLPLSGVTVRMDLEVVPFEE